MSDSEYVPTLYQMSSSETDTDTTDDDTTSSTKINSKLIFAKNDKVAWIDIVTEDDYIEIVTMVYEFIDEYLQEHVLELADPDFHKTMLEYMTAILFEPWEDAGLCSSEIDADSDEEDNTVSIGSKKEQVSQDYLAVRAMVETIIEEYYEIVQDIDNNQVFVPIRSHKTSAIVRSVNVEDVESKIIYLQSLPQPAQRTPEWYEFRYQMISASSLSKVFGSEAVVNSLIYEKCKPFQMPSYLEGPNSGYVNTSSPMHWGQKYEPLTRMMYEKIYSTEVADFGCIRHQQYPCIGASPDGINVNPTSERYGRMLEIKNIVNREIDGIPSKPYWIQMQIQMETCNLDECDFLETRFIEYSDEETFWQDTEEEYRGVLLYFVDRVSIGLSGVSFLGRDDSVKESEDINRIITSSVGGPHYEYMPLDIPLEKEAVDQWINSTRTKLRRTHSLYETTFWKMADFSCVLVERNSAWFTHALPQITNVWNTILQERQTGYEHRAAKKRLLKPTTTGLLVNKLFSENDA